MQAGGQLLALFSLLALLTGSLGYFSRINLYTSSSGQPLCAYYDGATDDLFLATQNLASAFLKVSDLSTTPTQAFSISLSATQTCRQMIPNPWNPDYLIACFIDSVGEIHKQTGAIVTRVLKTPDSADIESCNVDVARGKLWVLTSKVGDVRSVQLLSYSITNSTIWALSEIVDVRATVPSCNFPNKVLLLTEKWGYITCDSIPPVIRWKLGETPTQLYVTPNIGTGTMPSYGGLAWDERRKKLVVVSSMPQLALLYSVDEDAPSWTLDSVRLDPETRYYDLVATDPYAGLAVVLLRRTYVESGKQRFQGFLELEPLKQDLWDTPYAAWDVGVDLTKAANGPRHFFLDPLNNKAVIVVSTEAIIGTSLYTAAEVLQLSDCQQYLSPVEPCTACISPGDYYCGWCLRRKPGDGPDGECVRVDECTDADIELKTCPVVQSIWPTSGSTAGGTLVTITGAGFDRTNTTCQFTSTITNETIDVKPISVDQFGQRALCETPSVGTEGDFTLTVTRGLQYRLPTAQTINFYNCSAQTSCSQCAALAECKWCIYDAECRTHDASCLMVGPEISAPNDCPTLSSAEPDSSLVISAGESVQLRGNGFVPVGIGSFVGYQCVWTLDNTTLTSNGNYASEINGITCSIPSAPAHGIYSLTVHYRTRRFTDNSLPFNYYNCSAYTSCSTCLVSNQERCGWCLATQTCQLTSAAGCLELEVESCPSIQTITPPSAFANTSPTLVLEGGNFTSTSPTTWECDFGSLGKVAASRISTTTIECTAPAYTPASAIEEVNVTILHDGVPYVEDSVAFYYYDCQTAFCSQCLSPITPQCSYCVTSGTCAPVDSQTCSDVKLNVCPVLFDVTPSATTPSGGIEIVVNGDFLPSLQYHCRFNLPNSVSVRAPASLVTTTNSSHIQCIIPDLSTYINTTLLGVVTLEIDVEDPDTTTILQYSSNSLRLDIIVCSEQTQCSSCILAPQCEWCDLSRCDETPAGCTTYSFNTSCPVISALVPSHSQIDKQTDVIVQGSFIEVSYNLLCRWTSLNSGLSYTTDAMLISPSEVKCTYDQLIPAIPPNSQLSLQLFAAIGDNEFVYTDNLKAFTLIDCHSTSSNCTECSANISPFCGWCLNTFECVDVLECPAPYWTRESCPVINSISPNFGLVQGGATVTISGNFIVGSEDTTFDLSCKFGDVITDAVLVNSSTLVCQSPSSSSITTVPLSVVHNNIQNNKYSQNEAAFEYIDCKASTCGGCFLANPRCDWCTFEHQCSISYMCNSSYPVVQTLASCPTLTSLSPATGSIGGGTNVTLVGTLFVPHPNLTCVFGDKSVPALYINSTHIQCTTPAIDSDVAVDVFVTVTLNDMPYLSSAGIFQYMPDLDPSSLQAGLTEGQIALMVLLILFVIALVAGISVFVWFRSTADERENRKWLKLRTPNFEKVVFSLTSDLDYELSSKDMEKLKILERALDDDANYNLAYIMGQVVNTRDLDTLSKALVYYYASKQAVAPMLSILIAHEVEVSKHEGTLFRSNSVACKVFSHFAKFIGLPYLWNHLAFFINQLHEFGKEERKEERESILGPGTMEVDPERLDLDEPIDEVDLRLNQLELLLRASKILKAVMRSVDDLPREFRVLARQVMQLVGKKFPNDYANYKAVGGFLFLRYICPSILAPHVYGLIEEPPNATSQRYFVLLAKTLQNLANETLPGAKEDYMVKINSFITQHIPDFHRWVERVINVSDDVNSIEHPSKYFEVPESLKYSCLAFMANVLYESRDKLSNAEDISSDVCEEIQELSNRVGAPGKKKSSKQKARKKKPAAQSD